MKILFFSDIHGLVTNLDYIRDLDKKEMFDKVVVLGDLYYMGFNHIDLDEYDNFAVKEFLMSFGDRLLCVQGNCDSLIDVTVSDFEIVEDITSVKVGDIDIYCTHGHYYSYSKGFDESGVLIYGHEHIPYIKESDGNKFICVGSISLPRGGSKPSYAIYLDKKISLYDIENNLIEECSL